MRKLPALLALLLPGFCFAAPAHVQDIIGSYAAGVTTLTATGTPSNASDAMYAVLVNQDGGYASPGCATVSDGTNSYTNITASRTNGSPGTEIWRLASIGTTSSYTVTCTTTTAGSMTGYLVLIEASGVGAVDGTAYASALTGAAGTTQTITAGAANTNATDFEVTAFASPYAGSGTATNVPTGFTSVLNTFANNRAMTVAWRISSMIETASATYTWTQSVYSSAAIASFLPSGGGSCTHSGATSAGALATPNGTTGSYRGMTGGFVTPDCSSINYKQPTVGNFGTT